MIIETKLVPEKLIFANGDFRIYACSTDCKDVERNKYSQISLKGVMPRLDIGCEYVSSFEVAERHPKFGVSYNCLSIYQDIPETQEGQRDYLGTIMTKLQLQEVYAAYPDADIVELIRNKQFDYNKVKGIGPAVFERIYQKVIETLEYKEMLSKFGKYGINYETIIALSEEVGSKELAIQKLEDCPYTLTLLDRWGFKRADVVAKKMGFAHDHPYRIQYGIKYTLEDNQQSGHTFMFREDLLRSACGILELSENQIEEEIKNTDGLKIIDDKVALQDTYNAEYFIAKKLKELLIRPIELKFDPEEFIGKMEDKHNLKLTHQQRDFFHMVKHNRVGLLVGYAGTGKTAMQKLLVELLNELGLRYTFLSPSAQAAKVTTSYTGVKATTIHKKIGWGMGKKERMLIELDEDFVIVDEAGMMDIFIQNMLLHKLKNPKARILFVGDNFQLLSVSAGNFLHDAIESGVIPMTKLDIVFRQQEGGLLSVATSIRLGQQLVPDSFTGKKVFGKDFVLHCVNQGDMEKGYKYYYNSYLNTYEPKNIMILSPTKKGNLGTVEINKYVQSEINPEGEEKKEHPYGDYCTFRTGDYIINTQNMYDIKDYEDKAIELVNGDKGILDDIVKDSEERLKELKKDSGNEYDDIKGAERNKDGLVIDYDGLGKVRMNFNEVTQLLHAWCITIHKSQGDSSKSTLTIADKAHKFQLSANLIYTAITRSIEKGVLLTQAETLNYAIRKVDSMRRNTFMQSLLKTVGEDMGTA